MSLVTQTSPWMTSPSLPSARKNNQINKILERESKLSSQIQKRTTDHNTHPDSNTNIHKVHLYIYQDNIQDDEQNDPFHLQLHLDTTRDDTDR